MNYNESEIINLKVLQQQQCSSDQNQLKSSTHALDCNDDQHSIISIVDDKTESEFSNHLREKESLTVPQSIAQLNRKSDVYAICRSGRLDLIKHILESCVDEHEMSSRIKRCFLIACEEGHVEILKYLMKKGVDVGNVHEGGKTYLHIAAAREQLEVIKYLCKNGLDLDCKDDENQACIHIACEKGNLEILNFLISNEAKLDKRDCRQRTPLNIALDRGHTEVAKILIDREDIVEEVMKLFTTSCKEEMLTQVDFVLKNYKQKIKLFSQYDEDENNILMTVASMGKTKVLMALLSVLVNEKELERSNLSQILHWKNKDQDTVLGILISHGQSMKMYCDILFSLEQELHINIEDFTECLKTTLGPSRRVMEAIKSAEQYYANSDAISRRKNKSTMSLIREAILGFISLALIPTMLSFLDIYTDCALIISTWNNIFEKGNQSDGQNCNNVTTLCNEDELIDLQELVALSQNIDDLYQLIFMILFILFPIATFFFEWLHNDSIGFKGWWRKKRKKTDGNDESDHTQCQVQYDNHLNEAATDLLTTDASINVQGQNGDRSSPSTPWWKTVFQNYPDVWWWWGVQLVVVIFWPHLYLLRKVYVSKKYEMLEGQKKKQFYKTKIKEIYACNKAILAEVCTESCFQPLLQLYLLLPCIISSIKCSNSENVSFFINNTKFLSITTSVSILSWSFSSYIVSKANDALSKLSVGFLVILIQCVCQISGRLLLITFLSYCNIRYTLYFLLSHFAIVYLVLILRSFLEGNTRETWMDYIKEGCKNISKTYGNIFINTVANLHLQIWVCNETQVLTQRFENTSDAHRKSNLANYSFFKNCQKLLRGLFIAQPTFWVEFLIMLENAIIVVVVKQKMSKNSITNNSVLSAYLLYISGLLFKVLYYKFFHIWRHTHSYSFFVKQGSVKENAKRQEVENIQV